jgi:hypothetical protein
MTRVTSSQPSDVQKQTVSKISDPEPPKASTAASIEDDYETTNEPIATKWVAPAEAEPTEPAQSSTRPPSYTIRDDGGHFTVHRRPQIENVSLVEDDPFSSAPASRARADEDFLRIRQEATLEDRPERFAQALYDNREDPDYQAQLIARLEQGELLEEVVGGAFRQIPGGPRQGEYLLDEQHRAAVTQGISAAIDRGQLTLEQINTFSSFDRGWAKQWQEATAPIAGTLGANNDFIRKNYPQIVESTFEPYASVRGDQPRALSGAALINEIGVSMNLPPNNVPQTEADWQALAEGRWELYTGEAKEAIDPVAKQIRAVGGDPAQVTVLPVLFDSERTGLIQVPLYRVAGADGQPVFVDNVGRKYRDLEDWKKNNQLPPGRVSLPRGGKLPDPSQPRPADWIETYEKKPTTRQQIEGALDTAALVGGLVVGGAMVIGTGGIATPLVGAAIAGYGAYRSGGSLWDRAQHGQSINPFTDPAARNDWFGLSASLLGLASLGLGGAAGKIVSSGRRLAPSAAHATAFAAVGSQAADTAQLANLGLDLVANWDQLDGGQKINIIAQMGFWGGMTTHQARQAGGFHNLYSSDAVLNRLRYDLDQYAQVRSSGFDNDPAYSAQAYGSVQSAASRIGTGEIRSAADLWKFLTESRSNYARVGQGDPALAGAINRRRTPGQISVTPITGDRYASMGPRVRGLFPDGLPGGGWGGRIYGEIDGEQIPLTFFAWSEEGGVMYHTDPQHLPKIEQHVERLYQKALDPSLSEKDFIETVASMHWWLAQSMPNERGSAAISDTFARTLMERRGIPVPNWREGVVPDLEAIFSNHDDFVRHYASYFERRPR